jgi:DNA-binding Lrp family transcriptional regulator
VKITVPLSNEDLEILKALEKLGAKTSTRDLSELLGISDRTIRYRLKRLREKDLLHKTMVQTYERKIGLGEEILLLQGNPKEDTRLVQVLDSVPIFYYYAPTYGRYDGYFVYAMFPLANSHMLDRLIEEMLTAGLIEDCYRFELVDYIRKGTEVARFLPESTWTWQTWYDQIDETMAKGSGIDVDLDEFPQMESFDFKDVQILMNMIEDAEITLKELSKILGLSQPQVHKRVKRLEETGIIRGYLPFFYPCKDYSSIAFFFDSDTHTKQVHQAFYQMPFPFDLSINSRGQYHIRIGIPPSEVNHLLMGIQKIKPYTEGLFSQTFLPGKHKGHVHLLSAFNQDTNQWDIPIRDYLELVQVH